MCDLLEPVMAGQLGARPPPPEPALLKSTSFVTCPLMRSFRVGWGVFLAWIGTIVTRVWVLDIN